MQDDRQMSQAPTPKLNLRRLEQIQRLLQYGAVLVLLVFITLIVVALFQLRGINRKISSANANLQQKQGEMTKLEKDIGVLKEQQGALETQVEKKNKLIRTIDPVVSERPIELSLPPPASKIQARIYVQIGNEGQRNRAGEVVKQLEAKGYIVPGIENVKGKAVVPKITQLRYYQTDGLAEGDVKDISSIISDLGIKLEVTDPLTSSRVRPRHYELWFGNDF